MKFKCYVYAKCNPWCFIYFFFCFEQLPLLIDNNPFDTILLFFIFCFCCLMRVTGDELDRQFVLVVSPVESSSRAPWFALLLYIPAGIYYIAIYSASHTSLFIAANQEQFKEVQDYYFVFFFFLAAIFNFYIYVSMSFDIDTSHQSLTLFLIYIFFYRWGAFSLAAVQFTAFK